MNQACTNMQNAIADHVLGVLSEEQTQALRSHLAGCAGCAEYLRQLEDHSKALIACGARVEADMAARCEKAIEALGDVAPVRVPRIVPLLGRLVRTAVAAVLILGAGIVIGRFTTPRAVDAEQLRADVQASVLASLKPAVLESVLAQVDQRLEASHTQMVTDITEQTHRDLRVFANELLSGTQTLVDRRFTEVVQLIEAGRLTDRRQVAKALDQIKTQTGIGLLRLAAWTEETPQALQN
ncbi:MAG: zf-HC2 domain-containing protein [Sedimentisphaerales bacterium]|nr:zf-HC2 domain-containing protein [Sedimentisphaerales bacterium]